MVKELPYMAIHLEKCEISLHSGLTDLVLYTDK